MKRGRAGALLLRLGLVARVLFGRKKKKKTHRWIDTISQGVLALSTEASVDSSQALCVDPGSTLCSELSWINCAAPLVVEYLRREIFSGFRVSVFFFKFSARSSFSSVVACPSTPSYFSEGRKN